MAKTKPQPKEERAMIPVEPGPDIAPIPAPEAAQAFLDELRGPREAPKKVPLIKIHHKEVLFELPSGELVPEVSGYPVYYFLTRRWYERPPRPGEKGVPPDCWSADMVKPHVDSTKKQCEVCAECEHNEFGTARDGRSKACGTYIWIGLLNPQFGDPPLAILTAPPSSLREILGTRFEAGAFAKAAAKYRVHEIVWLTLGLEQMGDQVQYAVLKAKMGGVANLETAKNIAAIRNQWLRAMDEMRGLTGTGESTGVNE